MERKEICKKNVSKILENFEIGRIINVRKIAKGYQNKIFLIESIKDNKKKKFVLKYFENRSPRFVEKQTIVRKKLLEKKIPNPKIIRTKKGKDFFVFRKKPVQLEEFVNGKKQKLNEKLVREIGRTVGKMNKELAKISLFKSYDKDYIFRLPKKFEKEMLGKSNIKKESVELLKELKKLNRKNLKKSLIHTDINLDNLRIEKNEIKAIIDFNDIDREIRVLEPSVFIADELVKKKVDYKKIELFFKEYQKFVKLGEEEKKSIYFLIKFRYLSAINWFNKMAKKHPSKEKVLKKSHDAFVKRYSLMKKEGFEKFFENIFYKF